MKSPRLVSSIAMCCLFAAAASAWGDETNAGLTPRYFRQLLHVGDTVLLRTVNNYPAYTMQLLSREQANEVQTPYATYVGLKERRESILTKLEAEGQLSERAALYVQQQALQTEMAGLPSAWRIGPIAYEVAFVGEDFLTLKKPGTEKFVPLRSIRDMHRSDTLSLTSSPRSGRRSSARPEPTRRMQIRLENTMASVVAAIVHKTYPDLESQLTADAASNSLIIEADSTTFQRILGLVKALDAAFPETTPPPNEGGR